jgi:hypothetical protein
VRLAAYKPDHSNAGVWLWLVLIVVINAEWIACDLWLRAHNHEYLTTEFREGLKNPYLGPLLAFLVAGTVAAFVWHMYFTQTPPGES